MLLTAVSTLILQAVPTVRLSGLTAACGKPTSMTAVRFLPSLKGPSDRLAYLEYTINGEKQKAYSKFILPLSVYLESVAWSHQLQIYESYV